MAADKNRKKRDDDSPDEPVVRDKRRIDPETGEARKDVEDDGEKLTDDDLARLLEEPVPAESGSEADAASEHLHDLKRVQAEYANYRKRVDRDRYVARDLAVAEVITGILPVLDDLDLAHAHGDLEGSPLELVAQKLRTIFGRYGLVQVGEAGEPFDPNVHEAIAQIPSKDATSNTIAEVVQPGYRLGERLLRPAKVAVSVPEE
ncbi:MAG TPA: nucleotide exchange factor GrpE [Terrimesophilobacter sp.]|nr:nucleotide exchange factor GrpE [Terrimesophilobacter sp.]